MHHPTSSPETESEAHLANLRLQVLVSASRAFIEVGTDYREVLSSVAQTSADLINGGCVIRLLSADGRVLDVVASHDCNAFMLELAKPLMTPITIQGNENSPIVKVFQSGQLISWSISEMGRLRGVTDPNQWHIIDALEGRASLALVAVPMRAHGKTIGVFSLARHGTDAPSFSQADIDLAQNLADSAMAVISKARLFDQLQNEVEQHKQAVARANAIADRLRIMARVSQMFAEAGHDYQSALERVAKTVSEFMGGTCVIRLLSEDKQLLNPVVIYDTDPQNQRLLQDTLIQTPLNTNAQIAYVEAFRNGKPFLFSMKQPEQYRTENMPPATATTDHLGVHSCMWVPMMVQGQPIGLMTLASYNTDLPAFTEEDLQLAQTLANRAAAVIENARLFKQVEDERRLLASRVEERTAELRAANAQLIRASQLKDNFLASMSHELRTPLNSILGQAEILLEQLYGPTTLKQTESIQIIENSGQHLLNLINDILDLAKVQSGSLSLEIQPIGVYGLCDSCIRMVSARAARKKIKISTTLDSAVEIMSGDPRRMKQILINLLTNAIKFTPEGGKVGLEVSGFEDNNTIEFVVRDTGIGIAVEDQPKLFSPFVQLDNSLNRQHEGAGLGLSLVKQFVDAHHGSISVESTLGKGSCFRVKLPWRVG